MGLVVPSVEIDCYVEFLLIPTLKPKIFGGTKSVSTLQSRFRLCIYLPGNFVLDEHG